MSSTSFHCLTFEERQILIRRALELDGLTISPADEALVEERLAEHNATSTAISLQELKIACALDKT
jgi:hypothetical protein